MTDEIEKGPSYDQLADDTSKNIEAEETSSPARIEVDNEEGQSINEDKSHQEVKLNMMGSKKKKKFEVDDLLDDLN